MSAAGPGANLALAVISLILCTILAPALNDRAMPLGGGLGRLLLFNTLINVLLAVFNLIPLGPLDGSGVLEYFLPRETVRWLHENRQVVTIVVFALIFLGFFRPVIHLFRSLALVVQQGLIELIWGYEVALQIMQL